MMTKEQMQLRVTQLEAAHAQTVSRVNVIAGQIFELKYLIQDAEKTAGNDKPKPAASITQIEDAKALN